MRNGAPYPDVKWSQVMLISHLHLMPCVRKSGTIHLLLLFVLMEWREESSSIILKTRLAKTMLEAFLFITINTFDLHSVQDLDDKFWLFIHKATAARQYGKLKYWFRHQRKKHKRHMEEDLLPLFYPPAGPHHVGEPVITWKLWPECLAAGDSSTKFGENLKVLPDRRESRGGGGAETVCGHPSPRAWEACVHATPWRGTDV